MAFSLNTSTAAAMSPISSRRAVPGMATVASPSASRRMMSVIARIGRVVRALDEFIAGSPCRLSADDCFVRRLADLFVCFERLPMGGLDRVDNLLWHALAGTQSPDERPGHFCLPTQFNGPLLSRRG